MPLIVSSENLLSRSVLSDQSLADIASEGCQQHSGRFFQTQMNPSGAMVAKLRRASLLKHKMHKVSQIDFAGICKRVAVVYEKDIYEQAACCLITLNCLFHGQMARFVYAAHLEQELSARLEAKVAIWFVSFCAGSICAHWCACPVCPASVQPIGPRPSLRKLLESQIVIAPPTRRC